MTLERVMEIIIDKEKYYSKLAWNYVQSDQLEKATEIAFKIEALNEIYWQLLDEEYGLGGAME